MTTTSVITNDAKHPGKPPEKDRSTPYILAYKAVHNIGSCNFMGPNDFQEAIKLGQEFCRERKWRFIHVRPLFIDIDEKPQNEEERKRYES